MTVYENNPCRGGVIRPDVSHHEVDCFCITAQSEVFYSASQLLLLVIYNNVALTKLKFTMCHAMLLGFRFCFASITVLPLARVHLCCVLDIFVAKSYCVLVLVIPSIHFHDPKYLLVLLYTWLFRTYFRTSVGSPLSCHWLVLLSCSIYQWTTHHLFILNNCTFWSCNSSTEYYEASMRQVMYLMKAESTTSSILKILLMGKCTWLFQCADASQIFFGSKMSACVPVWKTSLHFNIWQLLYAYEHNSCISVTSKVHFKVWLLPNIKKSLKENCI